MTDQNETPGSDIVSNYYENYKQTQASVFAEEAHKTRKVGFWIAIILFASNLISLAISDQLNGEMILNSLTFPVVYVLLALLAIKQPMLSAILYILVFAGIIILTIVLFGARGAFSGLLVKAVLIYFLFAGMQNAIEAEKARKEMK